MASPGNWHCASCIGALSISVASPPTGRPRAHHQTIISLYPGVRRQTGTEMFWVDDEKTRSNAADSAVSAACSMLAVRRQSPVIDSCDVWYCVICVSLPSVLWHCWLGIRKSIWPINVDWWCVCVVICLDRGADCLHIWSSWCHCIPKPRNLLPDLNPDWFHLYLSGTGITWVVVEKRLLNGCTSSSGGVVCVGWDWLSGGRDHQVWGPRAVGRHRRLQ